MLSILWRTADLDKLTMKLCGITTAKIAFNKIHIIYQIHISYRTEAKTKPDGEPAEFCNSWGPRFLFFHASR